MKPEEKARKNIDCLLEQAGWKLQDYENLNLGESLGIAVRYFQLKTGEADYLKELLWAVSMCNLINIL